jgi:pimeloyl-ACP methyl ester carboxylesterase
MHDEWQQGDLDIGCARIHYRRTGGEGKRPLVLVHGFSDDGLCWAPVARELEGEYDIVMPDMLGHGLSSRWEPGIRIDMAEDLAALVSALGLERPLVAGHSMGAMVSSQAVARRPGLASALALEDPPWFMPGAVPGRVDASDAPVVAWAKTLRDRSEGGLLAEYRREHPTWPEELVRAMCSAKKRLDQGIVDELGKKLAEGGSAWPPVLAAIRCPLLLVAGDPALGAIVGPDALARVREIKPDARIELVPGAGHLIRFDAHARFVRALRSFLADCPR